MTTLPVGQSWDGSTLAAWTQQVAPVDALGHRAREVTIDGRQALALACHAGEVSSNPRAQLYSPPVIEAGCTFRVDVELMVPCGALPASFPAGGWVEFLQFAYGPPYAGSPPLRLMTQDGATFGLRLADQQPYPWKVPLERDMWWRFVCEFKQMPTPTGWFRLLVGKDGAAPVEVVPQTAYQTMQASNGGGANALYLDAYMAAGTADRVGPVYFARPTVTRLA